jgi:predicted dehydrogenase
MYAVVGYGYWGPNIVRNLHSVPNAAVKWVCDLDAQRRKAAEKVFPNVRLTAAFEDVLNDPEVDVVVISTPVISHRRLALAALHAGKHVFIEKPLAKTVEECRELLAVADSKHLMLAVGHTFVYAGAVRKLKELLDGGAVGELLYVDSVRTNLGPYRSDVNAVWDLATHDLSILDYLLDGTLPLSVAAVGKAVLGDVEDFAYLTLWYPNDLLAHIHVNWFAPVKLRQMLIAGRKSMLVFDDNEVSEKVRMYDKGGEMLGRDAEYEARVQFRTGDVLLPKLDTREPLFIELCDINEAVRTGSVPVGDASAGLRVVQILEGATRSLSENGRPVDVVADSLAKAPQWRLDGAEKPLRVAQAKGY